MPYFYWFSKRKKLSSLVRRFIILIAFCECIFLIRLKTFRLSLCKVLWGEFVGSCNRIEKWNSVFPLSNKVVHYMFCLFPILRSDCYGITFIILRIGFGKENIGRVFVISIHIEEYYFEKYRKQSVLSLLVSKKEFLFIHCISEVEFCMNLSWSSWILISMNRLSVVKSCISMK